MNIKLTPPILPTKDCNLTTWSCCVTTAHFVDCQLLRDTTVGSMFCALFISTQEINTRKVTNYNWSRSLVKGYSPLFGKINKLFSAPGRRAYLEGSRVTMTPYIWNRSFKTAAACLMWPDGHSMFNVATTQGVINLFKRIVLYTIRTLWWRRGINLMGTRWKRRHQENYPDDAPDDIVNIVIY